MTTTTATSRHRPLFPELYPIISSHLPLYAAPQTLLALAQTNHYHASVIIPILRSCLVLRSEEDAFSVLQQLSRDDGSSLTFGSLVREIHILASLSVATRTQTHPLDVVRRVEDVILAGRVPMLHTLCIQLTHGWHTSWHWTTGVTTLDGFGRFSRNFFPRMQQTACPRFRCLVLEGFQDYPNRPWVEDSGVFRLSNMTHLSLKLSGSYALQPGGINMSEDTMTSIADSLPELYLTLGPGTGGTRTAPAYLFSLDFPKLRSLTIPNDWVQTVPPSSSMAFLVARHATLEHLKIHSTSESPKVILEHNIPEGFFPKLRHLSAGFKDIERLPTPILKQLVSLTIERCINHQLSRLFDQMQRLPYLKSLAIGLDNQLYEIYLRGLPNPQDEPVTCTMGELINSIARAAPNLEELAFFVEAFPLSQFVSISQELNALPKLTHIYYTEHQANMFTQENQNLRERFSEQVKDVAEAVNGLRYITHIHPVFRPYLTARILRDRDEDGGGVVSVLVREGYGMKNGYDNGALPWGPV